MPRIINISTTFFVLVPRNPNSEFLVLVPLTQLLTAKLEGTGTNPRPRKRPPETPKV